MLRLDGCHMPKVPVKTIVRILTNRAGVEHHHIGTRPEDRFSWLGYPPHAGLLQKARDPLGIMDIHLAAIGDDVISARTHGGPTLDT